MTFIRKVKTASGATAVQIAYKVGGKIVKLEHLGSAHNQDELTLLVQLAKERLLAGQIINNPPKIYSGFILGEGVTTCCSKFCSGCIGKLSIQFSISNFH